MAERVRVGVRVRPLLPRELRHDKGSTEVVKVFPRSQQIRILSKEYTFDNVFGPTISQDELYKLTAGPMLDSFLQGFNVTIMAYGQTGSGKTFTMGSEAGSSSDQNKGLIPRFLNDVFNSVTKERSDLEEWKVSVSFIEIMGNSIHDLLNPNSLVTKAGNKAERKSLEVHEVGGCVVVSNLTAQEVMTPGEALEALHMGTDQRTTAATLMNAQSSRSHAIFTVTLQQTLSAEDEQSEELTEEKEPQLLSSKLTFVDLAGSERIKKTGAEGARLKEGIQINAGLSVLGQVINALAESKVHIPYRDSKLTRLLKDALGGNSQTLFLACCSPAEMNSDETLSTLRYANAARNIKNKPVKNTDSTQEELRRLRCLKLVYLVELVRNQTGIIIPSPGSVSPKEIEAHLNAALEKNESLRVYIESLDDRAQKTASKRYSVSSLSIAGFKRNPIEPSNHDQSNAYRSHKKLRELQSVDEFPPRPPTPSAAGSAHNGSFSVRSADESDGDSATFEEGDFGGLILEPGEDLKILEEELGRIESRETELESAKQQAAEEVDAVDGEIRVKENRIKSLKATLQHYHGLKADHEKILAELRELENEKLSLEQALESASHHSEKDAQQRLAEIKKEMQILKTKSAKKEASWRVLQDRESKITNLTDEVKLLKRQRVQKEREKRRKEKDLQNYKTETRKEKGRLQNQMRKMERMLQAEQRKFLNQKALMDRKDLKIKQLEAKNNESRKKLNSILKNRNAALNKFKGMKGPQRTARATKVSEARAKSAMRSRSADPKERPPTTAPTPTEQAWATKDSHLNILIGQMNCLIEEKVNSMQLENEIKSICNDADSAAAELRSLQETLKELTNSHKEMLDQAKENEELHNDGSISGIEDSIHDIKQKINGVMMKLDFYNSNIQDRRGELSRVQAAPLELSSDNSPKPKAETELQSNLLNLIEDLAAPSVRSLLWHYTKKVADEKVSALSLSQNHQKASAAEKDLLEKLQQMKKEKSVLQRDFEVRLESMEIEHQNNILALVQDMEPADVNDELQSGVEGEFLDLTPAEMDRRTSSIRESLARAHNHRDKELEKLKAEYEQAQARIAELEEIQRAARRESLAMQEKVRVLESAAQGSEDSGTVESLEQLQELWGELGLSEENRSNMIRSIGKAISKECRNQLEYAGHLKNTTRNEIENTQKTLGALWGMLQEQPPEEPHGLSANESLGQTKQKLEESLRVPLERVKESASRRMELRSEALELLKETGSSAGDSEPGVSELLRVDVEPILELLKKPTPKIPESCSKINFSMQKINEFQKSLCELRVAKGQMLTELAAKSAATRQVAAALGITSAKELEAFTKKKFLEGKDRASKEDMVDAGVLWATCVFIHSEVDVITEAPSISVELCKLHEYVSMIQMALEKEKVIQAAKISDAKSVLDMIYSQLEADDGSGELVTDTETNPSSILTRAQFEESLMSTAELTDQAVERCKNQVKALVSHVKTNCELLELSLTSLWETHNIPQSEREEFQKRALDAREDFTFQRAKAMFQAKGLSEDSLRMTMESAVFIKFIVAEVNSIQDRVKANAEIKKLSEKLSTEFTEMEKQEKQKAPDRLKDRTGKFNPLQEQKQRKRNAAKLIRLKENVLQLIGDYDKKHPVNFDKTSLDDLAYDLLFNERLERLENYMGISRLSWPNSHEPSPSNSRRQSREPSPTKNRRMSREPSPVKNRRMSREPSPIKNRRLSRDLPSPIRSRQSSGTFESNGRDRIRSLRRSSSQGGRNRSLSQRRSLGENKGISANDENSSIEANSKNQPKESQDAPGEITCSPFMLAFGAPEQQSDLLLKEIQTEEGVVDAERERKSLT